MKNVLCVIIVLVLSCTPTYLIYPLSKDELAQKTLMVAPFSNCSINYAGSVETEFGKGDQDSLIRQYLQTQIAKEMKKKSCFKEAMYSPDINTDAFVHDSQVVSGKKVRFMRPHDGFNADSMAGDVVLAVYNVSLRSMTTVNMVYFVPIINRDLNFKCSYVYWDIRKKTVLACGNINEVASNLGPVLTMHNWEELMESIVEELLINEAYAK